MMKNKIYPLRILMFLSCLISTFAYLQEIDDFTVIESVSVEKTSKAQQPIESWSFELENSTESPLYIQLFYEDSQQGLLPAGEGMVEAKKSGTPGYIRANGIDPRKNITLYVWWKKDDIDVGRQVDLGRLLEAQDRKDYRANRKYIFKENDQRSSIFVRWDKGEPKLAPSKATGVFSKKTTSGLPIKHNVTATEIEKKILSSD